MLELELPSLRAAPSAARIARLALALPGAPKAWPQVVVCEPEQRDELRRLAPLLRPEGDARPPYVVLHHAQRDLTALRTHGLEVPRFGCLTTAATLLAEGSDGKRDRRPIEPMVEDALERGLAPDTDDLRRLATHADVLVPLMKAFTPALRAHHLNRLFELECDLVPAVIDMEDAGMGIDAAAFERIAASWAEERRGSVDEDRANRLDKLLSTYRWWARDYADPDGRIRCRLHPLATDSGRFSCSDPNLQQVPSQHTAPGLRACFVPAPGHKLVVADYAQIELRVAAHLAPCDALRDVFRAGRDPHRATAATLTGKPEGRITPHERKLAKAINFGFLFGMGARRFRDYAASSYGIDLDEAEARAAREAFLRTYPGIAAWHQRTGRLGRQGDREDVVVRTVMGRRKRFAAGRFSYPAALNIPVQGTAAEGFKLAMLALHRQLPSIGGRGVLVVHDEYVAEVPAERVEEGRDLIDREMVNAMSLVVDSVPIVVEAEIADHWS